VKLQVVDPTHEQMKFVQSSINQSKFEAPSKTLISKNPLLANPIYSNQLSLKLWLEINRALKASSKYLSNHV
jgi:hypothetical protein